MQNQFAGAPLQPREWKPGENGNGIVVELPPAHGVEIEKKAAGIMIPTPPEIARQRPKALLRRAMKRSSVRASLTTGATWAAASVSMLVSSSV